MDTRSETDLSLMVRYWGNETSCTRTFDILVDGQKLATETLVDKWRRNEFVNQEYAIPNSLVQGKTRIEVKFQATSGTVGGLFGVRLLRKMGTTGVPERTASLDGRPFVQVAAKGSTLHLDLVEASDVPTTVLVRRLDGRSVRSLVLPAGAVGGELDLRGKTGLFVVQVLREGALIQASRITITR
jgi:hypothetical protein